LGGILRTTDSFVLTDIDNFPNFYCWTENQAKRGAIAVSSALTHFLTNYNFKEKNISLLRLFSDGCAGQNRNAHVVHALYWWLLNKSPDSLKEICMTFPVRGHSFLPADRMFGILEKSLRKHAEILTAKEYHDIYGTVGVVHVLGEDWHIHNFRDLCDYLKKPVGISDMKRVRLRKIMKANKHYINVKLEYTYTMDDLSKCPVSLLKRGHAIENIERFDPPLVPLRNKIKAEKLLDIKKLLQQRFGENWKNSDQLQLYVKVIDHEEGPSDQCEDDEIVECECMEEEPGLSMI
ncbi:hypothetical protein ANN_12111, partial [Periplaneta americana]